MPVKHIQFVIRHSVNHSSQVLEWNEVSSRVNEKPSETVGRFVANVNFIHDLPIDV